MRTCNSRDQVNSLYLHSIKHDFSPLFLLPHFIKMEYKSIRAFPFSISMLCVCECVRAVFRTTCPADARYDAPRAHCKRVTGAFSRSPSLTHIFLYSLSSWPVCVCALCNVAESSGSLCISEHICNDTNASNCVYRNHPLFLLQYKIAPAQH